MLTEFGKCLRRIRLEKGQRLKDMADILNITSAYLSSVENGIRKPTKELVNKLINKYNFNDNEKQVLIDAFSNTINTITIDTSLSSSSQADLGLVFARKINSLSEEQIDNIKKILKSH